MKKKFVYVVETTWIQLDSSCKLIDQFVVSTKTFNTLSSAVTFAAKKVKRINKEDINFSKGMAPGQRVQRVDGSIIDIAKELIADGYCGYTIYFSASTMDKIISIKKVWLD